MDWFPSNRPNTFIEALTEQFFTAKQRNTQEEMQPFSFRPFKCGSSTCKGAAASAGGGKAEFPFCLSPLSCHSCCFGFPLLAWNMTQGSLSVELLQVGLTSHSLACSLSFPLPSLKRKPQQFPSFPQKIKLATCNSAVLL